MIGLNCKVESLNVNGAKLIVDLSLLLVTFVFALYSPSLSIDKIALTKFKPVILDLSVSFNVKLIIAREVLPVSSVEEQKNL